MDDDDDDDDAISGSRLVVAGVPAPGILLFDFFRRAGERKNVQKWKSTVVLRCLAVFFALFPRVRKAYFGRVMSLIDNFLKYDSVFFYIICFHIYR